MEEINKPTPLVYCSRCTICKQLDKSSIKKICIKCFQWAFGISVTIAFIVNFTVFGFLCWSWLGNRRTDSSMLIFNFSSTPNGQTTDAYIILEDENLQLIKKNGFIFVPFYLNFSSAAEFCRKQGWSLVNTISTPDEELLQISINTLEETYFNHCNQSFIGFRRLISEEWKTDKDEPILGDNLFTFRSLSVKSNCVAMVKEHNYAITNVECELNDPTKTACYICESKNCSNNFKTCFKLFIDFVNSVKEANERCQGEMPKSKLAAIVNFSLQQDIVRTYKLDDLKSRCSHIFLGMRSHWLTFENPIEKRVSYDSKRLKLLNGTSNDYCVSITREKNGWNSAECGKEMCFICRE